MTNRRIQEQDASASPTPYPTGRTDPLGVEPVASETGDPQSAHRRGGLASAFVALLLIVLGVLAFVLFGGFGPDNEPQAMAPDTTTTGSIGPPVQPGEQVIPPLEPNDPAEPVQPSPAN